MKFLLLNAFTWIILLVTPNLNFGQAPDLGDAAPFAVFTAVGAFTNDGATVVTGDIGTDVGAFSGFPPGIVIGEIHVADPVSAMAAPDVLTAYAFLDALGCGLVLGVTLGNGQILTPDIYCIGAASTINGNLVLDAEGDPDAIFVFQIDGALSTSVLSSVTLINSASICNVYWQVNGEFTLGDGSVFRGTLIANGAIHLLEASSLEGRALSSAGAIDLHNNVVSIGLPAVAAIIIADGPTSFCEGDSVILSGNIDGTWSTGATTSSITVTTTGDYFVVNTTLCGSDTSNHILVTTEPAPTPSVISGDGPFTFCEGEDVVLSGNVDGTWSTGETTTSITVTTAGDYYVVNTNACGSDTSNHIIVTVNALPVPSVITADGPVSFCAGDSVTLSGNAGGTWSNGAVSTSITVYAAGDYYVVNTNACGSDTSNHIIVTVSGGSATITCPADVSIQCDESTLPSNTGTATANDNCGLPLAVSSTDNITPGACPQVYTIDRIWSATDGLGNTSTCVQSISVEDNTPPGITCPANVTLDCTASTLPASNGIATAFENCDTPPGVSSSDVIVAGSCAADYTILRTWTATNECGITNTCVQTLTIQGSGILSITCPADLTVPCASMVPAIDPAGILTTNSCGGVVTVTHTGDVISLQTCDNRYILTRSYLATDECSNTVACAQVITIADDIVPIITFTHPLLAGVSNGGTISVQCMGQNPEWSLPIFEEGSVDVADNCTGNSTVAFTQAVENQGNCEEDGYINLYRLTWNATDVCGNSSSAFAFLALTDTIPPVIHGVPIDITVSCNTLPALVDSVYATDECLCACVMMTETSNLNPGCMDGQVMTRSWSSSDACGNVTIVTQNITFIDNEGPTMQIELEGMTDLHDGSILEYTCSQGGIPDVINDLGASSISNIVSCGNSAAITFSSDIDISNNCELSGYIEQHTFNWESTDLCGNTSTMSIFVRLIDDEAPELLGVPAMVCVGDPLLDNISAIDNCGEASILFSDFNIPNPCGDGTATRRTYEANDECGNLSVATVILIPNDQSLPVITFVNPDLAGLTSGMSIVVNCVNHDIKYTPFGINDIKVEDGCQLGSSVNFTERLMTTGDCIDGIVAVVELKWTAVDLCGNQSVLTLTANVVDESKPVFVNYNPEITIGCNDELPQVITSDNCGEVSVGTIDSIIPGECEFVYDIHRSVTLTDPCGNTVTRQQIIHVGSGSGPRIDGVVEEICDDLSIPVVTAYDVCADEFVEVTMHEDTLDVPCVQGLVIRRSWTATGVCGIESVVHQTIMINDHTPPEILISSYSVVRLFTANDLNQIYLSQVDLIQRLNELDGNSVFFADDCDQEIIPVFNVEIETSTDCLADGFVERRTYTWTATDACGNASTLSFSVDIVDDVPPVFTENPADATIVCVPLPPASSVVASDASGTVTLDYSETTVPGSLPGEFIITRTWTATDACGNISVFVQVITWIPNSFLECTIEIPDFFECNSHGVVITSVVAGGIGVIDYDWEIVGEKCFIQGGQGTPEITIYVGWTDVKLILTVTDEFGCVSMCMIILHCQEPGETSMIVLPVNASPETNPEPVAPASLLHLNLGQGDNLSQFTVWPNPVNGTLNFSFESDIDQESQYFLYNALGQIVKKGQLILSKGFNQDQIGLDFLPEGAYLLQLRSVNELHSKRLNIIRS